MFSNSFCLQCSYQYNYQYNIMVPQPKTLYERLLKTRIIPIKFRTEKLYVASKLGNPSCCIFDIIKDWKVFQQSIIQLHILKTYRGHFSKIMKISFERVKMRNGSEIVFLYKLNEKERVTNKYLFSNWIDI